MAESAAISIVIPARNEEKLLPRCLASIAHSATLAGASYELIVVLNRCTDRTEAVARAAGAEIITEEAKNLAAIRNAGARKARGEILIFLDADSRMHPKTFRRVLESLSTEDHIGGGTILLPERYSLGIILTLACLLPYVLWEGLAGGLFFVRKRDFEMVGGFDERLHSVEDIDFARRLKGLAKRQGRKFVTLWSCYIVTSMRKFDRFGDWYFLLHPKEFKQILGGRNQALADKVWYDFER